MKRWMASAAAPASPLAGMPSKKAATAIHSPRLQRRLSSSTTTQRSNRMQSPSKAMVRYLSKLDFVDLKPRYALWFA
ncbi:MAG: hypothetical protein Q8M31_00065 [Beijerinckiaceae bacterium]|nr:hypothetical protein [Beijerinckiaceae bacterium]